jgi:hypothetical protein
MFCKAECNYEGAARGALLMNAVNVASYSSGEH